MGSPDGVPDRYLPLYGQLIGRADDVIVLTIAEIELALRFSLPERARTDSSWWRSTPRNAWTRAWLRADRRALLEADTQMVRFTAEIYAPKLDAHGIQKRHQLERDYARSSLRYPPDPGHLELRWWEPHVVYVLHVTEEHLFKVGHTRHDAKRLRSLTARGRAAIVQRVTVANLWAATLVEGAVLERTISARKLADPFDSRNGQSEHWDDTMAPPSLETLREECSAIEGITYWAESRYSSTSPAKDDRQASGSSGPS
jgi:hypothetical protein